MSLEAECGWTLLRAITVSLVATPLVAILARTLQLDSPRHHRRRLLALAIPFLTPGFVVGYAYSNVTLDLVHQPVLNELFYDLLLLIGVVPVGTFVLVLAPPPPLGPTADWCGQLAGSDRLRRVRSCDWPRSLWYGPARNRIPAFGLMALLVFHEFEIASLFRVIAGQRLTPASWSNALFELIALQGLGQRSPWDLWRFGWMPLSCSLALLAPLLALAWTSRRDTGVFRPTGLRPRSPWEEQVASTWLAVAVAVGTAIPLGNLIYDGAPGWAATWRGEHRLGPTLAHAGRSLIPTVAIAVSAAIIAGWLLRRRHPGLLMALSLPGLLGNLSLGLLLTWTLLIMAPAGFGHSIGALLIGQSLWLLPRAALLIVLLAVLPHRESTYLSRLLQRGPTAAQRIAGWRLTWQHFGQRVAWMVGLLCWWGYLELTLNELLAPPEWLSVAHRMYQQMHFGRNAALSSTTLVVVMVPLAVVGLLVTLGRSVSVPTIFLAARSPRTDAKPPERKA